MSVQLPHQHRPERQLKVKILIIVVLGFRCTLDWKCVKHHFRQFVCIVSPEASTSYLANNMYIDNLACIENVARFQHRSAQRLTFIFFGGNEHHLLTLLTDAPQPCLLRLASMQMCRQEPVTTATTSQAFLRTET